MILSRIAGRNGRTSDVFILKKRVVFMSCVGA